MVEQYDIGIIPLNFYASGKIYKDWVDITPSEAYELFLEDPDSFKTSAATPEDCLLAYRKACRQAPNILCITVSTELSAVYNVALEARDIFSKESPQTTVVVLNSLTATAAEGFIALAAIRAAAEGKDLDEVIRTAEEIQKKVDAILFLDTIRHVYRSGRIPKIASQIGTMLNIKPILSVGEKVHFHGAVRNRKQGIERILQTVRDKVGKNTMHAAIMHAYAPDEAEKLKEQVASEFNCAELWLSEFSPIMGYACGTGAVGIAFYPEDQPE